MRRYLVTYKDGTQAEVSAPHHMTLKNADKDGRILFARLLPDGSDINNLPEKSRYYSGKNHTKGEPNNA